MYRLKFYQNNGDKNNPFFLNCHILNCLTLTIFDKIEKEPTIRNNICY